MFVIADKLERFGILQEDSHGFWLRLATVHALVEWQFGLKAQRRARRGLKPFGRIVTSTLHP